MRLAIRLLLLFMLGFGFGGLAAMLAVPTWGVVLVGVGLMVYAVLAIGLSYAVGRHNREYYWDGVGND